MSAPSAPLRPLSSAPPHRWTTHVRATALFLVVTILVTGLIYPLFVTAIADVIDPSAAGGSLLRCANGTIVGSADIAQNLSAGTLGPTLFWARPSMTDYDTTLGAVTPPGPTDPALLALLNETIAYLVQENATGNTSSSVFVVDGSTDRAIGSVPAGLLLEGVAVDAANDLVYAASAGSRTVVVINGSTSDVVGSIPVGVYPQGVAVDSIYDRVYVTDAGSGNVSVINGSTDKVVGSIPVGSGPRGVAVDGSNGQVYVTNSASNNVSVINGSTDKVVGSIPVGVYPQGVAVDSARDRVYVTVWYSSNASLPFWWVAPSGSSVDPDITPASALVQVPRINATTNATVKATAGINITSLVALVNAHITQPRIPYVGVPFVNVLELDMALLAWEGLC